VEMRALDVDMSSPYGVNLDSLYFCEAFLIYCLLKKSPLISEKELRAVEYNEITVALRGREPGLLLNNEQLTKQQTAKDWILEIFEGMVPICEILDGDDLQYTKALRKLKETITHPELLPSAKILQTLRERKQEFHSFALELSAKYSFELKSKKLSESRRDHLDRIRSDSFDAIQALEKDQNETLEEYIQNYLAN